MLVEPTESYSDIDTIPDRGFGVIRNLFRETGKGKMSVHIKWRTLGRRDGLRDRMTGSHWDDRTITPLPWTTLPYPLMHSNFVPTRDEVKDRVF